jgi:hypothetical protein
LGWSSSSGTPPVNAAFAEHSGFDALRLVVAPLAGGLNLVHHRFIGVFAG